MVDPTTVNKLMPQPTPGSDVDLWATPYNSVFGIIDNSFGGLTSVALAAANVVLASSQSQCVFLQLTGALAANVSVTLPAVGSFYTVINNTTNSSAFTVTMLTTAAGGRQIGLPLDTTDIMTDGTNVRFRSLPYVGSYWYYGGSSVPAWVTACTVPPWLYCNGTLFSSASYPSLNTILGSSFLPDLRGRIPIYLNDGSGRVTSGLSGIDGNTRFSAGGAQITVLSSANLPNISFPVSDPSHTHAVTGNDATTNHDFTGGGPGTAGGTVGATIILNSAFTNINIYSGGSNAPFATLPPGMVAGITMIRGG